MKWIKLLAVVLGSQWFFPVSCTTGLYAGIHVMARVDARDVGNGDRVHPGFSVVVEPGGDGQPFQGVSLSEVPPLLAKGEAYSPVMSKAAGTIRVNDFTTLSYHVVGTHDGVQTIEVMDQDDDRTIWSRYRASRAGVEPVASRMFHVGYMFGAFPYAFGLALLLYGIGRRFRTKQH